MRDEIIGNRGSFTMRKLAQQQETNMARKKAREEAAATRSRQVAAMKAAKAARKMQAPPSNKMLQGFANKAAMPPVPTVSVPLAEAGFRDHAEATGLTVTFASETAEALAKQLGLTDADFEGVEPGPRGFSAPQVRNLR